MVTNETPYPATPPSVNDALSGPNPASSSSHNPLNFFNGKGKKIALVLLLILIPITVLVALSQTVFKPKAAGLGDGCEGDQYCSANMYCDGWHGNPENPGSCACRTPNEDGTCAPDDGGAGRCDADGAAVNFCAKNPTTGGALAQWVCNGQNADGCQQVCKSNSHWTDGFAACVCDGGFVEQNGQCIIDPSGGGCGVTAQVSGGLQCGAGGEAEASITFTNTCASSTQVTYTSGVRTGCSFANGSCGPCGVTETSKTVVVPGAANGGTVTVSESCTAGDCEACQVDLSYGENKNTGSSAHGSCGVTPPPPPPPGLIAPSCTGLTLNPAGTVITAGGQTRTLAVMATGGTPPYTATWVTNNSATVTPGTSSTTATWRAPATLPTVATTWTITPTIKDSANRTLPANAACGKTLTFTIGMTTPPPPPPPGSPPPSPTPPPPPPPSPSPSPTPPPPPPPAGSPSHMVCQNYACVSVSGSGSNECSTNASCQPPQAGMSWPTVVGVGAGFVLTLLGALLLL